jgi:hypothetical protein
MASLATCGDPWTGALFSSSPPLPLCPVLACRSLPSTFAAFRNDCLPCRAVLSALVPPLHGEFYWRFDTVV